VVSQSVAAIEGEKIVCESGRKLRHTSVLTHCERPFGTDPKAGSLALMANSGDVERSRSILEKFELLSYVVISLDNAEMSPQEP
jgi:hypothetical protein